VKRKARRREAINSGGLNFYFFLFFLLERKRLGLHREARGQGKRPAHAGCFRGVSGSNSFFILPFFRRSFFTLFFFFWEKSKPKQA
jgi:hypothetical protein